MVEEYLEWLDTYGTASPDEPTTEDVLARCLSLPGASPAQCNFDTAFTPRALVDRVPAARRLARSGEEPVALSGDHPLRASARSAAREPLVVVDLVVGLRGDAQQPSRMRRAGEHGHLDGVVAEQRVVERIELQRGDGLRRGQARQRGHGQRRHRADHRVGAGQRHAERVGDEPAARERERAVARAQRRRARPAGARRGSAAPRAARARGWGRRCPSRRTRSRSAARAAPARSRRG